MTHNLERMQCMLLIRTTITTEREKKELTNNYGIASTVLNPAMVTNKQQLLDKDSCE